MPKVTYYATFHFVLHHPYITPCTIVVSTNARHSLLRDRILGWSSHLPIVYWGYIGGYIGIMENMMETTIIWRGCIGVILG